MAVPLAARNRAHRFLVLHNYVSRSLFPSVACTRRPYTGSAQPIAEKDTLSSFNPDPSLPPDGPSQVPLSRRKLIQDAKPFSEFLTDKFNRQHDYLRISITEKCNLRCLYCMPEEGVPQSPKKHLLNQWEIIQLARLFVAQGVTKIRLTGGEPTVNPHIEEIMSGIGELRAQGLKELCLTTNGLLLANPKRLARMAQYGLTGVNLSLDTLDPFQFEIMTRRRGFENVMRAIDNILEMNSNGHNIKLKVNCVVIRGLNDNQIIPFVEMTRSKNIEVRFIEYMPFDGNKWASKKMLGYREMLSTIEEEFSTIEKVQDHPNDTSKTYKVPGFTGRLGFITSMTDNFCGSCNRLRITADGNLKVCLFGNAEVSLRDSLRGLYNEGEPLSAEVFEAVSVLEKSHQHGHAGYERDGKEAALLDIIGLAVKRKKAKHAGIDQLQHMKNRPMILIGG